MKRHALFSKFGLFLALPIFLIFAGCTGKKENSSETINSPSNNIPSLSSETNAVSPDEAKTAAASGIIGKITLKGTPPPERDIAMDANCGKLHTKPPKTRLYVVSKEGELADVFVYIKEGLGGKTFPPAEEPGLIDQVNCEYTPYVLGVQTGQKLIVRNSDPMMHNVHAMPKVAGNKESNKAQMPKSKDFEYTFEKPELFVTYKCDVHPWMYAYVGVVEHPFFAVSRKDGTFQLKDVPAGKYLVEAYHRKAGKQTQEVTVMDGKSEPILFTFELP